MSTENEGTAVPPAPPSAPPAPVDAPAAAFPPAPDTPPAPIPSLSSPPSPHASYAPHDTPGRADSPYATRDAYGTPADSSGTPGGHGVSAPDASWPPPAPGSAAGAGDPWGTGPTGPTDPGGAHHQPPGFPPPPPSSAPEPKPGSGRGRGGLLAGVLVAALLAGGLGGGLGYTLAKDNDETSSTTVSASDSGGDVKRDPGTVAGVAAQALPSTVTIEAASSSGEGGTGTGFVFDTEGHIITNNHVVAEAVDGGTLNVTFPSGKKYDAEVIGNAQGYDVAVIKLNNAPSDLKPLTLGNSDKVAVGDSTIAIGAPFGLSNTVTTGIISAKNRPVASSDGSGSQASYMSALQTDASINPGNSGGPLLDAQGNVIGINSAIQSSGSGLGGSGQSGSIGLGFAIPINQAKYVAEQLIKTGKPVYAKIGASVSLEEGTGGAKITDTGAAGTEAVEPGGPAADAGLKPGDVITKLDDRVIDSGPTLIGEIWTHKPGDKVTLTYERDGKTNTVDVTLDSRVGDS
ncbi:trypsin-like peptidase domain-containing protein [Streptomyces sp. NPDC093252]|uniref:S1C family serine protease n=1 Tax=Streptomyces sp. NPDC093252 TaxID=3154980 RepID=UPI00342AE4B1